MTPEIIGGLVRAILSALGGILVTKGWLDNGTLETIIGGTVTVIVAIWSILAKKKAANKLLDVNKQLNSL